MQHAEKIRLLTAGRDLSTSSGLEIGPRESPLITRAHGPVLYADYTDTATIRATLPHPSIDPARVVEIDIVTGGGKLSAAMAQRVDYIVASHVAEHVPDLLGWLADLHLVLKPGGTLGLAIPDRRFTFDRYRAESTIAEAVEAFVLEYQRPSLRQIFDSAWQAIPMEVAEGWRGGPDEAASLRHRLAKLPLALQLVRDVHASGRYNDAHCWVFTPASFLEFFDHAAQLALLPYVMEAFQPTEQGGYEFYTVFRRAEGDHAAETENSIRRAREVLAASPAEPAFAAAHPGSGAKALRAENEALRESLAVMRNSRFWRLTGPVRRFLEALRG
ncbi:MAG: methyltransferase domain-containing protein [Rhodospirillales bacterium]